MINSDTLTLPVGFTLVDTDNGIASLQEKHRFT